MGNRWSLSSSLALPTLWSVWPVKALFYLKASLAWMSHHKGLVALIVLVAASPAIARGLFALLVDYGEEEGGLAYAVSILRGLVEDQSRTELTFLLAAIPLFLIIVLLSVRPRAVIDWPFGRKHLEEHTGRIDALPEARLGLWIALASGLGLFLELMIIRIHSSYFQLFAYFKNVSLLSCFLGLGIGYARGSKRPLATPLIFPFIALQVVSMYILRFGLGPRVLQNPISEQFTLGLPQAKDVHSIIAYGFVILIFVFNALCFVPLGHLASRLMMRREKLVAYSWNLVGSIAGIIAISLLSLLRTPPAIWLLISAAGLMLFMARDLKSILPSGLALIVALILLVAPINLNEKDIYSPYQILTLVVEADRQPFIRASNTYYQRILDLSEQSSSEDRRMKWWLDYYDLPYRLKPDAEEVLIVGSGAGNDVAAAVRNGSASIDAVEIDPVILELGRRLHPEAPYQQRSVNAIVADARMFIQQTEKKYDLIVYGLLDSHTLLSGRSGGIRLDSYVYTVEAFKEARTRLREGGLLCLTFSIMNEGLGRKLYLMLQEAFGGREPVVYAVGYNRGYTFVAGENLEGLGGAAQGRIPKPVTRFASTEISADISTDDWPFFYMPVRTYPVSYLILIVLILVVSGALVWRFVPGTGTGFSVPCFFLGAGFMLVEAKGITELALVYGSTWSVVSVVITAILIMAFLANTLVIRLGRLSPFTTYGLLLLTLAGGFGLTFTGVEGLSPWLGRGIMTVALTLPLFFSGFAFSDELRKSASVAVALSSNLLGAMLGGFLEYNSMYFGFRSLYIFAAILYFIAFLGALRRSHA